MSENNLFAHDGPIITTIKKWRDNLSKGDRALLRRAHSPAEVAMQRSYYTLHSGLRKPYPYKGLDRRLPVLAGLMAHGSHFSGQGPIARSMVAGGGTAAVSDLRFRRLLQIETVEELYVPMIRVIRMLGGAVNIQDLTVSVLFWNDETRRRWAALYYTGEEFERDELNIIEEY